MENLDQILDAPAAEEKELQYAGFWIRTGAYLIDGIILGVINAVLGLLLSQAELLTSVVSLLLGAGYFIFMESSANQGTVGKMLVGIKVGDEKGEQLSFANALGRYFAKFLSTIILCIGFMMVGWDEKKQGLHDKLAKTYVFFAS